MADQIFIETALAFVHAHAGRAGQHRALMFFGNAQFVLCTTRQA